MTIWSFRCFFSQRTCQGSRYQVGVEQTGSRWHESYQFAQDWIHSDNWSWSSWREVGQGWWRHWRHASQPSSGLANNAVAFLGTGPILDWHQTKSYDVRWQIRVVSLEPWFLFWGQPFLTGLDKHEPCSIMSSTPKGESRYFTVSAMRSIKWQPRRCSHLCTGPLPKLSLWLLWPKKNSRSFSAWRSSQENTCNSQLGWWFSGAKRLLNHSIVHSVVNQCQAPRRNTPTYTSCPIMSSICEPTI